MIRVVNVRGMNKPEDRARVCYVGRPFAGWPGHPLANPFRPEAPRMIPTCLDAYRAWLLERPKLALELAELWEACRHGELPLGCWCTTATAGDGSPLVCHVQILAEMLRERFTPCAARLWNEGKPSPRTCERCGLGPCEFGEVRKG